MKDDTDDTPLPPRELFDLRDAEYALASPGLWEEERAKIASEARRLLAEGQAREAVCNWVCREVAGTVGSRSGFIGVDAKGNVIDPPHVVAARRQIKSEAGKKRQSKRNAVLQQWVERYWQAVDGGWSQGEAWERCWAAIHGLHLKADNKPVAVKAIAPEFEALPLVYGRDGKSPPKNKKRFRAHFLARRRTN